MSRYHNIHCRIWSDDKFPFSSDDCQLVFFHLLTSPMSTQFGLYKASIPALAAEKRWPEKRYTKGFREAFEKGFIKYDEKHQVILIPRFLKYNKPNNPNVLISWGKAYNELPECEVKYEFYQYFNEFLKDFGESFQEAFIKAFIKPSGKVHATATATATEGVGVGVQGKGLLKPDYFKIIDDLNKKTGMNFKSSGKSIQSQINARLNEGHTVEDFFKVHTNMVAKWGRDPKMKQYLRPVTLYSAKFDSYLNITIGLADQGVCSQKTERGLAALDEFVKDGKNAVT